MAIPSTFHSAANEHLGGLCIMNVNLNAPYPNKQSIGTHVCGFFLTLVVTILIAYAE